MIILMELEVEDGQIEDLREVMQDALDSYANRRADYGKFLRDNIKVPPASKEEQAVRSRNAARIKARANLAERLGAAVRHAKYLVKAK